MSDVPPTPPPFPPPGQQPPPFPQPPTQPPTQPQPPYPGPPLQPPQHPPTQPVPQQPGQKSRAGLVIALLVLLVLVAAAAVGGWFALSGASTEVSVDSCVIEADGTLRASGTVEGLGDDQRVDVTFTDADDGSDVDEDRDVTDDDGTWTASGVAGDDVQRVECTATVAG